MGLAADVGSLARLPRIIGSASLVCEMAYTAQPLTADAALRVGLTSRLCATTAALRLESLEFAATIASKSPLAVVGTKVEPRCHLSHRPTLMPLTSAPRSSPPQSNLLFAREHSVADSNERVAVWNAACLQTEDIPASVSARGSGQPPVFAKL